MLDRLDAVRWDELRELIRQSYEMVAAKAPKKKAGKKRAARTSSARKKTKRG
jgi:predicted DNA-binding protein (MmcQ/YjbR family)